MIQTKQELLNVLNANRDKILSFGVQRLGLFGSFVRDEANEKSDVDFLVDFSKEKKTLENIVDLSELMEKITGRKSEVVTPQGLSKYIGPYILKEVEYVSFGG